MEDTSLYDALELLGPVIMPEFSLVSDILSEFEEELTQSDEELAEAVNVINEAEGYEIDVTRANEADDGKSGRFPSVNDEEKENIIRDTESLATKRQTKYGVNIFRQWLKETKRDVNFEKFCTQKLDQYLRDFYAEVRNADGQLYSKSTFVGIRASISRHLRAPPFNKALSLMTDKEFHKSNQMFLAMIKKLKREGLDVTKHHPSISEGDLEKLRFSGVLSTENPKGLLRKVWFDIMLGFGRRGRENQRGFIDTTFGIKTDDRGFKFIEMVTSEITKNHRGGLTDDDFEKSPRIYATNTSSCPVASFELYMAKRNPGSNHFFQLPRTKVLASDNVWYTTRPIGERILNDMMKNISKDANLSRIYTNHCVRATTVNVLSHSGVSDREIMRITGHRCEASLSSYNSDSSDNQKRKYSAILQGVNFDESNTTNASPPILVPTKTSTTVPPVLTKSSPAIPLACQMNNMNIMQQINNLPVAPLYSKQFEVHNSTVHVYNYHMSYPPNQ